MIVIPADPTQPAPLVSIDHNRRAVGLCRDHGHDVPDVRGVAVVTSYDPTTGDPVDTPSERLDHLAGWE
jgi:hypothetical protein